MRVACLIGLLCASAATMSEHSTAAASHPVCSLMPFGKLKSDSQPYFIGITLDDTVHVGPGATEFVVGEGHYAIRGRDREIFGQAVRVERWGSNVGALGNRTRDTVVIVPWDYGPDCRTTIWSRTWQWLPVGTRLFFSARLRSPNGDSMPIFDAFAPQFDAYPSSYPDPVMGKAMRVLTVDQLFDLFEVLPSTEAIEARDWPAVDSALTWAQANPVLASKYPAREIGFALTLAAGEIHVQKIPIPVVGTYRFTFTYPNGTQRSFYLRTGDRASGPWHILRGGIPDTEPQVHPWTKQLDGYELSVWVARRENQLPDLPDFTKRYQFPMGVREVAETTGSRVSWRADFETSGLDDLSAVVNDPQLDSLARLHGEWFFSKYDSGGVVGDPGRFTRDDQGNVTFEQPIPLIDGRVMRISGERVSLRTVRDTLAFMRFK
jgi:hypothetical protein